MGWILLASYRKLYIAAYDISCPKRLRRALFILKGYASGRQKSVFEVYVDAQEKSELLSEVADVLHDEEDRFFLLQLSGRKHIYTLGIGVTPVLSDYIYLG